MLVANEGELTGEFFDLFSAVELAHTYLGTEGLQKPVSDLVIADPDLLKQLQQLLVELGFIHPGRWMVGLLVVGAEIVDVVFGSGLGLFCLTLAANSSAAVGAVDQSTAKYQFMRSIDDASQQLLGLAKGGPIHKRLMRTLNRPTLVWDFTDVGPILDHAMQHGP